MKNVYGKRVLVTGATSGIGKACAEAFARSGCQVIGVSRSAEERIEAFPGGAENAKKFPGAKKDEMFPGGGSITYRRLDVTDEAGAKALVESLEGVDIAVLCAGMGVAGPAETTPAEMTRRQMEVNYFGTLNVAQPCLTRMRGQGKGLLIVIGSIAGRVSIPMQSQYSASKYALEAFVDAVRMEMKGCGVRAVIIEPGDTKTGFTDARDTLVIEDETSDCNLTGDSEYAEVLRKSVAKMAADEQGGRPPESVAKIALALAGRKNPPARVPVGLDYKALMVLLRFLPDRSKEFILSKLYLPK